MDVGKNQQAALGPYSDQMISPNWYDLMVKHTIVSEPTSCIEVPALPTKVPNNRHCVRIVANA